MYFDFTVGPARCISPVYYDPSNLSFIIFMLMLIAGWMVMCVVKVYCHRTTTIDSDGRSALSHVGFSFQYKRSDVVAIFYSGASLFIEEAALAYSKPLPL